MTTNSSNHSEAVQKYIDATQESTFKFDRLSPDEDDTPDGSERTELDESE